LINRQYIINVCKKKVKVDIKSRKDQLLRELKKTKKKNKSRKDQLLELKKPKKKIKAEKTDCSKN